MSSMASQTIRRRVVGGRVGAWAKDPLIIAALIVSVALVIVGVFGHLLAPYDPLQTDVLSAGQGPSAAHPFGTDALGRDILSRVLVGARLSLLGPAVIVAISIGSGLIIALAASWHGGAFSSAVDRVLNVLFAIPGTLVAIIVVAAFGVGFWAPVLALSVVYIPFVARVLKASAGLERRRPYVEAFELAGMSPFRINVMHILRNLMPLVLAQATLTFGSSLIDFGALSFMGLGVPQPTPEWGAMVSAGRSELLSGNASQTVAAGSVIVLTVVTANLIGERITRLLETHR